MSARKGRGIPAEMRRVELTLRQAWDPIGGGQISDLPADEYASYAPRIISLLRNGASDREIAAYLEKVEQDMHLTPRPISELESVAALLREAAIRDTRAS